MRDETSSLLWLRDDESHDTRRSTCTENSELLDSSFIFDREVFGSRPYLTAMKSNMKRVVREAHSKVQAKHASGNGFEGVSHSEEDAQTSTGDTEGQHGAIVDLQSSKGLDSKASEARSYGGSPPNQFTCAYGDLAIDSRDLSALETTQSSSSRPGSMVPDEEKSSPKRLNQGSRRLLRMPNLLKSRNSVSSQMSLDIELESPRSVIDDAEKLLLIGNAKNSGSIILRAMEMAYGEPVKPTASEDEVIRETLISRRSAEVRYKYRIYDVVGLHSKENKWIYSFDKMSTLIYVVDLSSYNLTASDDRPSSCIQDDLALFQQICASKWLAVTPILLLLCRTDILTSKLRESPLADYFPDYTGSPTDPEAAKSFFRQNFLCLNQKFSMRIWVLFIDSVATVKLGTVIVANVDNILTEGTVLAFGAR